MPVLIVWVGRHIIYIRTSSVLNGVMIYIYVYIEVCETLIGDHWSFESIYVEVAQDYSELRILY